MSVLFDPIPAESCASLERNNSNQLLGGPRVNQDRKLAERPDNDCHLLRCWHEWEFDGREKRIILCVETARELRPGCEDFDARQLDQLVEEAVRAPVQSIQYVSSPSANLGRAYPTLQPPIADIQLPDLSLTREPVAPSLKSFPSLHAGWPSARVNP